MNDLSFLTHGNTFSILIFGSEVSAHMYPWKQFTNKSTVHVRHKSCTVFKKMPQLTNNC